MSTISQPSGSDLSLLASRRERRSAETRERLFRSALQLFAQKGFEETTVEDITEAADVGKGTFFNYFPSKDHILIAFSDMQIGKLEQAVGGLRSSGESLPEFMRGLVLKMTEEPIRNPGLIRALLRGYLSTTAVREMMIQKQNHAHGLHKQMIEIGQARGEVRGDIPAAEIAHFFRQSIFGTLLIWSVTGDATLRERIDSALQIFWSGIEPRNSAGEVNVDLLKDAESESR
jgi:AcrR family transcriptional regulator